MSISIDPILFKLGQTDYVKDGIWHKGGNTPSVMVNNESELSILPKDYPPGTLAYTAGFKALWQLDSAGKWISIL